MMEKIRALLAEENLDAILLQSRHNVGYASGFWGSFGVVFLTKNENYLFTDFRYQEYAQSVASGYQIIISGGKYREEIAKIVRREGIETIGFEEDELTVAAFDRLKEVLPEADFVPAGRAVRSARLVKTPEETQKVRTAEEISCRAFLKTLEVIRPGMTELQLENELAYRMKQEGAEGFAFDSIVVSGTRSSLVHGTPSHKKIEKGDFVLMDFGAIYQNYCSDMTRTVAVGAPDDQMRAVYGVVKAAQEAALSYIRAGITGHEADEAARKVIRDAGYGDAFGHSLGHGVGVQIHEGPTAAPSSEVVLEEGMLLTVEPGIYLAGRFGVRIEDLVRVTEDGCDNLTHAPKDLLVL